MTDNYNIESMVPTEIEAVSPIPDEKFWRPLLLLLLLLLLLDTVFSVLRSFIRKTNNIH
jgi:hypothetical protein